MFGAAVRLQRHQPQLGHRATIDVP